MAEIPSPLLVLEADRHDEHSKAWSDHLWRVLMRRHTDFEPYGDREREGPDCSCGCLYFVPLAGPLGADWGVCGHTNSPRAGLLTWEHQGCMDFVYDDHGDDA